MSWVVDDGLVPGHYTVSLSPADPNTSKIHQRYRQSDTSGLEVDVPVDQDQINFDIELVSQ
jgi:hypothetical protein